MERIRRRSMVCRAGKRLRDRAGRISEQHLRVAELARVQVARILANSATRLESRAMHAVRSLLKLCWLVMRESALTAYALLRADFPLAGLPFPILATSI